MRRIRLVQSSCVFLLLLSVASVESAEEPRTSDSETESSLMAIETIDGRTLIGHIDSQNDAKTASTDQMDGFSVFYVSNNV